MQLLLRSTRCPLISSPGDKLVLLPSAQYPPEPRQRLILIGAILLRRQHREAPLAFLFAADEADDAVDVEGIAPLVQTPNDDIAIKRFHGRSPHITGAPPAEYALANFAPKSIFGNLAGIATPPCKECRQAASRQLHAVAIVLTRRYAPPSFEGEPSDDEPPMARGWKGFLCPTRP
jgi:hypothetical protein